MSSGKHFHNVLCLSEAKGMDIIMNKIIKNTLILSYIIFPRFLIPLDLSNDAKVLYALLLDRAGISRKKGYIEADGTIRLYFTVEDAKAKLRRSRQVATRVFHELESCGLIFRRKQGLGRPAVITLNLPAKERRSAND